MQQAGIRELKQNASQVVAAAAAGQVVTITERNRPVAILGPVPRGALDALIATGRARPARSDLRRLEPPPSSTPGLSQTLADLRAQERY